MGSSTEWNYQLLMTFFGPRIFFAVLCGALIGIERELKNKAAGVKTNILICLGSTLYTSASVLITSSVAEGMAKADPSRIAAQIVSGIGFLGAGAIIQSRGTVLGLTTAATIWVVAAIGMCIGIGHSDIAIICTVLVVLILVTTNVFEDKVLGRSLSFACELLVDDPEGKVRGAIHHALAANDLLLNDFDIENRGGLSFLSIRYNGHRTDHKKFILELWSTAGIREVRQV